MNGQFKFDKCEGDRDLQLKAYVTLSNCSDIKVTSSEFNIKLYLKRYFSRKLEIMSI